MKLAGSALYGSYAVTDFNASANDTEGIYHFDEGGEGVRGYNVVKNDNGNVVFIKRVDFSVSTNLKH